MHLGVHEAVERYAPSHSSSSDSSLSGAAAVGVFDQRPGAEESTRAAGEWLRETGLAELVPNPPTITQGEVVLDAQR